jgi:hypothetical protein
VLSAHLLRTPFMQAIAQSAVYATWSFLVAAAWPYQRLDVHLPLVAWVPYLPARFRASSDWRPVLDGGGGWVWVSHLRISDALNWTALSANVVPLVNVVTAVASQGRAATVFDLFLIGLNVAKILLTLSAWVSCFVSWQLQARELAVLRAARLRKHRAVRDEPQPVEHASSAEPQAPLMPPVKSPSPLRRRPRRSDIELPASGRSSMYEERSSLVALPATLSGRRSSTPR